MQVFTHTIPIVLMPPRSLLLNGGQISPWFSCWRIPWSQKILCLSKKNPSEPWESHQNSTKSHQNQQKSDNTSPEITQTNKKQSEIINKSHDNRKIPATKPAFSLPGPPFRPALRGRVHLADGGRGTAAGGECTSLAGQLDSRWGWDPYRMVPPSYKLVYKPH